MWGVRGNDASCFPSRSCLKSWMALDIGRPFFALFTNPVLIEYLFHYRSCDRLKAGGAGVRRIVGGVTAGSSWQFCKNTFSSRGETRNQVDFEQSEWLRVLQNLQLTHAVERYVVRQGTLLFMPRSRQRNDTGRFRPRPVRDRTRNDRPCLPVWASLFLLDGSASISSRPKS